MGSITMVISIFLSLGILSTAKPYAPYIVDAELAKVGAWPWMASLRKDGIHLCGGVLIKTNVILTSALCANQAAKGDATVALGMYSQSDANIGKPEVIKISYFVVNGIAPKSNPHLSRLLIQKAGWNAQTLEDDLASAVLKRNATIGKMIQPIDIAAKDFDITDRTCTVTGWGATENIGEQDQTDRLHQKDLVGWTTSQCIEYLPTASKKLRCASIAEAPHGGACRYDAGGPLVCPVGKNYVLAGINLWWTRRCDQPVPSVFTYVPQYRDWIKTWLPGGSSSTEDTHWNILKPGLPHTTQ